jgi:hypothetical protein
MFGGLSLLFNKIAHKVSQKLCAGAVASLGGAGKLIFQALIDSEGEGCFAHWLT